MKETKKKKTNTQKRKLISRTGVKRKECKRNSRQAFVVDTERKEKKKKKEKLGNLNTHRIRLSLRD